MNLLENRCRRPPGSERNVLAPLLLRDPGVGEVRDLREHEQVVSPKRLGRLPLLLLVLVDAPDVRGGCAGQVLLAT